MKQFDELGPLFRRQCRQKSQGRREQLALQAAPRLSCLVKQPGRRRLIRVGFGKLGPGSAHHRFNLLTHQLHMRTKILGVSLQGLLLCRIENKLRPYPLKPLCRAYRRGRTLNVDPQRPGNEAQIECQG